MQNETTPVRPVSPVAPWLGGKSRLADTIIPWINAVDHALYAEPFVGMGGIFLRRNKRPKGEVINDYSRDVSNLFRIIQRHYNMFVQELQWRLTTRDDWENLMATPVDTMTDVQRAARFLYLLKTSFGGKVTGQSFGVDTTGSGRFDVGQVVPFLEDLHARLKSVTIECLNFDAFIERYDRPHTLFYIDPPYYGCEGDYGRDLFSRPNFNRLAEVLGAARGKFILSINDHPEVRRIFGAFKVEEVKTVYTIAKGDNAQGVTELLFHNLPEAPKALQPSLL
jgi:DNA adenine methylase